MNDEKIFAYLDEHLKSMFDILNTKTIECTMLKLKYIYYDDLNAYQEYNRLYNKLTRAEQKQVYINVCCSLVESLKNKRLEEKNNKVKEKER